NRCSGKFLRGTNGCSGPGIYFATTASGARSASQNGSQVVFRCQVRLGAVETRSTFGAGSYQFIALQNRGKDSVQQNSGVYVVYNYDQVKILGEE
ncbi:unnamed protein product, partial [Amoebophrya sp. A25]